MMLHTSSWLLCLTVAVGLAGERMTAAGPAPPALPLSTTSQMTLVFKTLSSVKPPDTPDGYSSNQMKRWTFQKPSASATTVPGYILITKNNLGGLYGTLTEMFYIPGMYKPVCTDSTPNTDKYYSAARVWVDNQLSQLIGRTLWGFPKEMATFVWTDESITVKDGRTVIFQANFSASVSSSSGLPSYFTALTQSAGISTIQYPIDDILTRYYIKAVTDPANQPSLQLAPCEIQFLIGQSVIEANNRAASKVKNQVANTQVLSFPTATQTMVATGVSVKLESKYFSGSRSRLVVAGSEAGFIGGSPGALSLPSPFRCY